MTFLVEHGPAIAIAIPFLAAFTVPLVAKLGGRVRDGCVVLSLALTEFVVLMLAGDVLANGVRTYALGASVPSLTAPAGFPVRIILEVDAMSALISLVAMTIAFLASLFSLKLIPAKEGLGKFFALFLLLSAGMMGMCYTGDFFTLFVFFEIVSISSAGMISFFRSGESFEAAFKYMVISVTAGLFLLFGVGILYGNYGMLNMAAIAGEVAAGHSLLDVAAISLIASALLFKSGSFPVHMWKPDVFQEAPANVVVMILTSSLVGLYVLFRILFTVFGTVSTAVAGWLIVALGAVSIIVGVLMAMPQRNLRRMIGFVAIAEIGYVMLGVGTGLVSMQPVNAFGVNALSGGLFHIVNDALNMSLIFLAACAVAYITERRDLSGVGGLAHRSAPLAVFFLIGLLAISGIPPMNGFASKLMIFESVFFLNPLLSVIGITGSILMLAVFVKVFVALFLGTPYEGKLRKTPKTMLIPMFVLSVLIILLGLFAPFAVDTLITPAAQALLDPQAYIGGVI
ncbi:MAG: NADH:ubiquinone oxidoreductase [Candidatus Aenigmatarchaeota archaeon]|nr:MAG: NADH:ubiquinone oxidoreductase [Candidatus Aenigmarchaeota archaeon]